MLWFGLQISICAASHMSGGLLVSRLSLGSGCWEAPASSTVGKALAINQQWSWRQETRPDDVQGKALPPGTKELKRWSLAPTGCFKAGLRMLLSEYFEM